MHLYYINLDSGEGLLPYFYDGCVGWNLEDQPPHNHINAKPEKHRQNSYMEGPGVPHKKHSFPLEPRGRGNSFEQKQQNHE